MSDDCKFCSEEKEEQQTGIRNGSFKIEMWKNTSQDLDDEFYLNVQHFNQNICEDDFKILYCPICGRKLNDKNRSKDYEELTTGKSTINEIRKRNELKPLMDEEADKKLILQKSLGETGLKIKVDATEVKELVEKLNQAKDLISEINVTLGSIKIGIESL